MLRRLVASSPAGDATRPDAPEALFRREGEYWTISYHDRTFRLRDSKGLGYLGLLLEHPGRELHVLELVAAVERSEARAAAPADAVELGLGSSRLSEAEDVIDDQARAAYRRRLADLKEELDEARASTTPNGRPPRSWRCRLSSSSWRRRRGTGVVPGGWGRRRNGPG